MITLHKRLPVFRIILIVWVSFSVLYVAYNEWNRFRVYMMQRSYSRGVEDAVSKVLEESKNCKGFPVNLGQTSVTLVNVECLKQQPQAEAPKPNK